MLSPTLFDADEIIEGLLPWVRCESPTSNVAGVNRMMDLAATELVRLGATIERAPGKDGFGDIVIGRLDGAEPTNSAGILILSHLDTVHMPGTLEGRLSLRRDGDRYYGPGIYDMKGGARIAM
ncbi:MAG: hypothetical protein AB7U78_02255, partial [Hyphomicrobiaceae bacterium]